MSDSTAPTGPRRGESSGADARADERATSFRQLEEGRRRLLAQVGQMPPDAQRWAPPSRFGRDPWTPLQVLDHLTRVEGWLIRGLREGMEARPDTDPEMRHRLGRLAVRAIFALRLRVRTPDPRVDPAPAGTLALGEVERNWYEAREELRQVLARIDDPGEPRIRHPVSGPLSTLEALEFLLDHQTHHHHQIRRIGKHPEFPWAVR